MQLTQSTSRYSKLHLICNKTLVSIVCGARKFEVGERSLDGCYTGTGS